MTTTIQATSTAIDAGLERYRKAERTLWSHYGIDPVERFVDIAKPRVRLRIVEVGPAEGKPVMFVPGTGGTGPYWAPLIRELSSFRCLMIDRPGWGVSSPIDYRADAFGSLTTDILRQAMDALGIKRADFVGASIGNLWGLHLARREPDRVGRIALIGGAPSDDVPIPRFIRLLASPLGAVIVRIPMSPKMARSQLEAIGHGAGVAAGRMDDFIDWRISFARDTDSMHHERGMVRALLGREGFLPGVLPTDAEIGGIQHPVRMLFGSADSAGSVEIWRRFTGRLPHGELQVVDGAGHMPWWDEPALVGRSVQEFLCRLPG